MAINRGEIWWADLGERNGSEQAGKRPVLIIQNNVGNRFSPTVIVASISSQRKRNIPTHVFITKEQSKLQADSVILCEQIRTIDKNHLIEHRATLDSERMKLVEQALTISVLKD